MAFGALMISNNTAIGNSDSCSNPNGDKTKCAAGTLGKAAGQKIVTSVQDYKNAARDGNTTKMNSIEKNAKHVTNDTVKKHTGKTKEEHKNEAATLLANAKANNK